MSTPANNEMNERLIDLSRAVSSMLESATTPGDIPAIRDEMLRAVSESADDARKRIIQPSSTN